MPHISILILIIFLFGIFGGITNYLRLKHTKKNEITLLCLWSGVAAYALANAVAGSDTASEISKNEIRSHTCGPVAAHAEANVVPRGYTASAISRNEITVR